MTPRRGTVTISRVQGKELSDLIKRLLASREEEGKGGTWYIRCYKYVTYKCPSIHNFKRLKIHGTASPVHLRKVWRTESNKRHGFSLNLALKYVWSS